MVGRAFVGLLVCPGRGGMLCDPVRRPRHKQQATAGSKQLLAGGAKGPTKGCDGRCVAPFYNPLGENCG